MSDRAKLIDRIKKIIALSESEKELGNLAAAENYAARVQKMVDRHKIEQSELSVEVRNAEDPLGSSYVQWRKYGIPHKQKRIKWMEDLTRAVAYACHCQFMISTGSSAVWFVGRQTDREVAEYLLVTLVRTAMRLADEGYWKARYQATKNGHYTTRGYKTSFLLAFSDGMMHRFMKEREQAMRSTTGMSLMVRKSMSEVTEYMKQVSSSRSANRLQDSSRAKSDRGWDDGYKAAREVEIRRGVSEGRSTGTPKALNA